MNSKKGDFIDITNYLKVNFVKEYKIISLNITDSIFTNNKLKEMVRLLKSFNVSQDCYLKHNKYNFKNSDYDYQVDKSVYYPFKNMVDSIIPFIILNLKSKYKSLNVIKKSNNFLKTTVKCDLSKNEIKRMIVDLIEEVIINFLNKSNKEILVISYEIFSRKNKKRSIYKLIIHSGDISFSVRALDNPICDNLHKRISSNVFFLVNRLRVYNKSRDIKNIVSYRPMYIDKKNHLELIDKSISGTIEKYKKVIK